MDQTDLQDVQLVFKQIVGLIQRRQLADAETQAKSALERFPNEPNLLRLLGVSIARQGRFQDAETPLKLSTQIAPNLAAGHEELGAVFVALGQLGEAEASFRTALKLNPKSESTYTKLGRVLNLMGRGGEADTAFKRSLDLRPERKPLVEAMEAMTKGEWEQARKIVREALRDDPNNVDALRIMGQVCMNTKQFNDAEAFLRRAVELAPDFMLAWSTLGQALQEQAKYGDAEQALQKTVELEPHNPHLHNGLASLYMATGEEEKALSCYEKTLTLQPDHAGALLGKGHTLKTIGQQEDAIEAYRAGAKVRPDLGEIYWSLANLKTFRFKPEEIELMKAQLNNKNVREESLVNFYYSLGKSSEDAGDYDAAFEYYQQGGAKQRMLVRHDPVEFEYAIDAIVNTFTPEMIAAKAGAGDPNPAPILIVGLPRSGSTLIEQIISTHSQVEGTAELPDLLRIATSVGVNRSDGVRYPQALVDIPEELLADLGKEYIDNTARHRHGAPYFTDKMPNNFSHIGLLHMILPNAKVIDARRHPLDSCFGTFKQLFAKGQNFSYDLFDLAEYYKQYVRVMAHWDQVLPGKVLRVQYEDMVSDMEGQARRLIAHCGLDWEDDILRFYDNERAVKTASSEQVRQPIYASSVNTWKRYEAHLGDLIEDLAPVIEALPAHLERPAALKD